MNTTYAVPVYAQVNIVEVTRFDRTDGQTALLAIDHDGTDYTPDLCGTVTIRAARRMYQTRPEAAPCCTWCVEANAMADRINAAATAADIYATEGAATPAEAVLRTLQRMGAKAATVSWNYYAHHAATVEDAEDIETALEHDGSVIVSTGGWDPEPYARECVAHLNGQTWTVGLIDTATLNAEDEPETFTPQDCPETFHGYVWNNVDSDGDSTPTAQEMEDRF